MTSDEKLNQTTKLTVAASLFWFAVKLVLGIVALSSFLIASALFTFALSLSKLFCLFGIAKDEKAERKVYAVTTFVFVALAGLFYCIYNVRLLYGFKPTDFGLIPAIAIAAVSFYLFVKSIVNLVRYRKRNIYYKSLKLIAFIGALTNILLTQTSLLMVEMPEMNQIYNVYGALGIGAFAFIASIVNVICIFRK